MKCRLESEAALRLLIQIYYHKGTGVGATPLPGYRGGCYPTPKLHPNSFPVMPNAKLGNSWYHFLRLWYDLAGI